MGKTAGRWKGSDGWTEAKRRGRKKNDAMGKVPRSKCIIDDINRLKKD